MAPVSETPNLDRLTELSRKLALLVGDPEPGLMTWNLMLGEVLSGIGEFVPRRPPLVGGDGPAIPAGQYTAALRGAGCIEIPDPEIDDCRVYDVTTAAGRAAAVQHLLRLDGPETLDSLVRDIAVWQRQTFPHATVDSVLAHLVKEVRELAAAPRDPGEQADVFHLLVGLAQACGYDLRGIVSEKFRINRQRQWGAVQPDGVVEHVREAP